MKTKTITVLNVSLLLIGVLLLLNFYGIKPPTLGKAFFLWDHSEPLCAAEFKGNFTFIPAEECCSYLSMQLIKNEKNKEKTKMVVEDGKEIKLTRHYYTSENTVGFWANDKAYYLCKEGGFFV